MKQNLWIKKKAAQKNFGKKILTVMLSAAMLLGLAVTALAADEKAVVTDKTNTVKKIWTVASETMFDERESFTLRLNYTDKEAVGTNKAAEPAGIIKGAPKDITIGGTSKWNNAGGAHEAAVTYAELFDGISFTTPGIYHFTLQEQDKGNPNIASSTQSYAIRVPVVWAVDSDGNLTGSLAIQSIMVFEKEGSETGGKVENGNFRFVNTPKANGSLNITKTVKGNAASKEDMFQFTIKITGVSGAYPTSEGTAQAINGSITKTVQLKHGASFAINNLPAGAAYTVTEESSGYQKTSYTIDGGTPVVIGDEGVTAATGSVKAGSTIVAFENVKNVTAPTGIVMDVLPYVLLFGAAILGGAAALIYRRRSAR